MKAHPVIAVGHHIRPTALLKATGRNSNLLMHQSQRVKLVPNADPHWCRMEYANGTARRHGRSSQHYPR